MPDLPTFSWLRTWFSILLSSSLYILLGLTVGGMLSLVAPLFGASPWGWFFAGICLPAGFLSLFRSSHRRLKSDLSFLKGLRSEGLLSAEDYKKACHQAMRWWSDTVHPVRSEQQTSSKTNSKRKKRVPNQAEMPNSPSIESDETTALEPPVPSVD